MKIQTAWMILENNKPACYDYRLPVFWIKRIAKKDADKRCVDSKIVKVRITQESPK